MRLKYRLTLKWNTLTDPRFKSKKAEAVGVAHELVEVARLLANHQGCQVDPVLKMRVT